jgi:hypothetical protein
LTPRGRPLLAEAAFAIIVDFIVKSPGGAMSGTALERALITA